VKEVIYGKIGNKKKRHSNKRENKAHEWEREAAGNRAGEEKI